MPNTNPALDSRSPVEYLLRRAGEVGVVRVLPIGAVTQDRAGKLSLYPNAWEQVRTLLD